MCCIYGDENCTFYHLFQLIVILMSTSSASLKSYSVLFTGNTVFFFMAEHEVWAADIKLCWGGRNYTVQRFSLKKKKKSQKKTSAGLTVSNPTLGGSSRLLTPCVHLLNLLLGHFPEGRKRLNSV